jgi:hypothetical protein
LPVTRDNIRAEVYCTIFALAESPHERDMLWAGNGKLLGLHAEEMEGLHRDGVI